MKKSILDLGKALNKNELKTINGANFKCHGGCPRNHVCDCGQCIHVTKPYIPCN